MSQISKIVLRIVLDRNKNRILSEIGEEKYGFMKGEETSNAGFTHNVK